MAVLTMFGRCIAFMTGFGYLSALVFMLTGGAGLVDSIYYTGNLRDFQMQFNYGDRHSLNAFQWCDDYTAFGPNRERFCNNIDMDCQFIYKSPLYEQAKLTLPGCSKFNFYRISIVLGSFFAFIALLLSFFSCYRVNRGIRGCQFVFGISSTFLMAAAVGIIVHYKTFEFDTYLSQEIFKSPLIFSPQTSALGSIGFILQVIGAGAVFVGVVFNGISVCGAIDRRMVQQELTITEQNMASYYTANPAVIAIVHSHGSGSSGGEKYNSSSTMDKRIVLGPQSDNYCTNSTL